MHFRKEYCSLSFSPGARNTISSVRHPLNSCGDPKSYVQCPTLKVSQDKSWNVVKILVFCTTSSRNLRWHDDDDMSKTVTLT